MTVDPLSPGARKALEAMPSRLKEYGRGELIVEAGTSPDESALLVTGCVFRFKRMTDGGRQIVALHVPGDFVDLHSFVLRPMDHSVAAAVPHVRVADPTGLFFRDTTSIRDRVYDVADALYRQDPRRPTTWPRFPTPPRARRQC